MAASFELPSTLRHALSVFAFTGKPLWTMSEGMRNVKIEITLLLQDRDPQPTNKRARAVPAPAAKPRRQPPAQPQRETPLPTSDVIATQPATVTLQRPASSTAVTPSPSVQQLTRPKKKIHRSYTPRQLPSTPHQPTADTAKVVYEPPEPSRLDNTQQVTKTNKIKNNKFLFSMMHQQNSDFKLLVAEDTTKPPGNRVYFIQLKNNTDWVYPKAQLVGGTTKNGTTTYDSQRSVQVTLQT